MKIIGVIPARYKSSRFPGKPLADICGKPMIWWVYNSVKKSKKMSEVWVLTDNTKIESFCNVNGINVIMTADDHPNHISRVWECSQKIKADCYVCVNGDEPLIDAEVIDTVIPDAMLQNTPCFYGAARNLNDASKVIDPANIKLVLTTDGRCLYMSRNPVPFPKGELDFVYKKYVGIECFNKPCLDFFVSHSMGNLEKIEDIDHLRFLENNISLQFNLVKSDSISVDTPKDLEYVRKVIFEKIKQGNYADAPMKNALQHRNSENAQLGNMHNGGGVINTLC